MLVQNNTNNEQGQLEKTLVITTSGYEHPELLATVSEILFRFKGSFVRTSFDRVHNHFSGLFIISINSRYLKSFVACLNSLSSKKLRFDFELSDSYQITDEVNAQDMIRFEARIWNNNSSGIPLELLKLLNANQLVVEAFNEESLTSANGSRRYNQQIKLMTEYVIDVDKIGQKVQRLAKKLGINLLVMDGNQELELANQDYQQAG